MRCASIRRELDGRVPLIGFAGSPVDHRHLHDRRRRQQRPDTCARHAATRSPPLAHELLELLARAVTHLPQRADRGRRAGASWSSTPGAACSPRRPIASISLRYMEQIVRGLTRESEGRRVTLHPCSPRAARRGWNPWRRRAAMRSVCDWTIDIGDARRRVGSRASRFRATSIPARCTRRPISSVRRSRRCSRATDVGADTSSTSVTASIPTSTRRRSRCWSTPCTR